MIVSKNFDNINHLSYYQKSYLPLVYFNVIKTQSYCGYMADHIISDIKYNLT